jgi:uncharacterized protein (DUF4415 family)
MEAPVIIERHASENGMRMSREGRRKSFASLRQPPCEKREQLVRLAARPDREIDLSDIPEIRAIPSDAVIAKFYRPKKTSVTIRLDADVLAWLKANGEGYQTRINSYLSKIMRERRQK